MAASAVVRRNRRMRHWRRPFALLASVAVLLGSAVGPVAAVVPPFSDVAGHKFASDIEWLRLQELTSGCGGGRFCPDGLVTRAQMASFLVRGYEYAIGRLPPAPDRFVDDAGNVHAPRIDQAAHLGLTTGVDHTRFDPNGIVRRDQLASFTTRLLDRTLQDN